MELAGAVIVLAELGDLTRFDRPRQLMSDLGLTPSESSSGAWRHHGGITRAGNSRARRALGDKAWASRYPAKVSRHLQLRLEGAGAPVPTVPAVDRPREARHPGRGGHCPRDGRLRLGQCAPRPAGLLMGGPIETDGTPSQ